MTNIARQPKLGTTQTASRVAAASPAGKIISYSRTKRPRLSERAISLMYVAATGTTPPMPSPWTNRKSEKVSMLPEKATARLARPVIATPRATVRTRPIRSPSQPAAMAPSSMPIEAEVTAKVAWPVVRFHSFIRTGSAEAASNWSNASKNVTAPIRNRTLTCQRDCGSRSSLAAMEPRAGLPATVVMEGFLPRAEQLRRQ